jgi:tetratricopeptide (TPR) repeat protein
MEHLLNTDPEDPRIYAMYGDYLSRDGKDTAALESYKKALQFSDGQKFQIWEQVLLIEIQNEMYDSLALHAPQAIEVFPNQPLPYLFAGVAQTMLGDYQEAIYFLEDGLNYVLGNKRLKEQFYAQLADAYHRIKNHAKSDTYFDKTLQVNPNNATALNNYAYYLAVRKEKLDKALELIEKSNRLSPNNPVFLDTYAWVLYQKEDYTQALEKIEKVFELKADQEAEVMEHYGDILKANGKNQAALEQYQKAAALGEVGPAIAKKIKALQ